MSAPEVPTRLLLATDLSCRCDRALDRTVLLARQWQAQAVALSVIEPGAGAAQDLGDVGGPRLAPRQLAERRLRADLAVEDLPVRVRVEQGAVAATIQAVAEAEQAQLVVTGVARNEALARALLGSSVDTLSRRLPMPLLVVRTRARAPYPRVRVATDLSDESGHALAWALAAFPEAEATLFHAFDIPPRLRDALDPAPALRSAHDTALRALQDWLAALPLPPALRARVRLALEAGDAAVRLYEHSTRHPEDLLVMGRSGRGAVAAFLLGSVTRQALEMVESDVLVVPREG